MRKRALLCAASACFGSGRTFSPLCFTDSGFNSDSTQYPADRSGHKQVCSFKLEPMPADNCTSFLLDDKRGVFIYSRCVFFRLMAALHGYTCCYLCGRVVCVYMLV